MTDKPPMQRASDFDPEVLLIFDQYVHGDIDRRTFLARVGKFAVGTVTAAGLLGALSPRFAEAQQVAPTDARLEARYVEYDSPKGHGKARGYLVRPAKAKGPLPLVLVVHENRGLNPHIEDVARRVALEHFVALAPDALFPLGGYPGDEDKARALFQTLDQPKAFEDFIAATQFLRSQPGAQRPARCRRASATAARSPTGWRWHCPSWRRRCRSTAARRRSTTWPRSRPSCCCTSPPTTSGSMPAGRRSRPR